MLSYGHCFLFFREKELATVDEFKKLECFREERAIPGRWKLVHPAKVVVQHNGIDYSIVGFNDETAQTDRNTVIVTERRGERFRYIAMRYVWIDPDQLYLKMGQKNV